MNEWMNEMNEWMKWMNEWKWNDMKWNEMKSNEMKWNEMNEWMKWNEWNERNERNERNEWMNEWMNERTNEWMNEKNLNSINEGMKKGMNEWHNEWNEMKWNEMKPSEVKLNDMKWLKCTWMKWMKRMHGCKMQACHEWVNEWLNEWLNEGMNACMQACHEWVNEWINEWMNQWMNGLCLYTHDTHHHICIYIYTIYIYIYTHYIYIYIIYICTYHVCLYIILHECMQTSFKMSGHATDYWNCDPNRHFFQNMRKQYYFIVHILNILYIYTHTFGVTFDFSRHLTPRQYFHRNRAGLHDPSIARVLRFICITVTSVTSLEKAILCSCALRMQRSVSRIFHVFLPGQGCWLDMEGEKRPMASNKAHWSLAKLLVANEDLIWFVVSGLDCEHVNLPPQEIWTLYNYLQDQRI